MKLIAQINDQDFTSYIKKGIDGFLLPLKGYAQDFLSYYTLEEIHLLRKNYPDQQLFLVMNEMLFNKDIEKVTQLLKEIETYQLDGIFFYDFAIYEIHKEQKLKTPLVFYQTHVLTNQEVPDLLVEKGILSGVLSSEITLDEIRAITKSKMQFFIYLVGLLPAGVSRRKLLSHFYQTLEEEKKSLLYVKEEQTRVPFLIQETDKSTSFFYGKRLNAAPYYEELSQLVSYGILKQDDLDKDVFLEVISLYKTEKDKAKLCQKTGDLIGRNTGFLRRKTIFKVKK